MSAPLTDGDLDAIAACGFAVYQNPNLQWRSYAFFAEGNHIGYLQRGGFGGFELATVHIPSPRIGTGFVIGAIYCITRDALTEAFLHAPRWADSRSMESVYKWPNIEAMIPKLVKVREARIVPTNQPT